MASSRRSSGHSHDLDALARVGLGSGRVAQAVGGVEDHLLVGEAGAGEEPLDLLPLLGLLADLLGELALAACSGVSPSSSSLPAGTSSSRGSPTASRGWRTSHTRSSSQATTPTAPGWPTTSRSTSSPSSSRQRSRRTTAMRALPHGLALEALERHARHPSRRQHVGQRGAGGQGGGEELRVLDEAAPHRPGGQAARPVALEVHRHRAHVVAVVVGQVGLSVGGQRDHDPAEQRAPARSRCGGRCRGGALVGRPRTCGPRPASGTRARARRAPCPAPTSRRGRAPRPSRGSPGRARTARPPTPRRAAPVDRARRADRLALGAVAPGPPVTCAASSSRSRSSRTTSRHRAGQRAARRLHVSDASPRPRLRERPRHRGELPVQAEHADRPRQRHRELRALHRAGRRAGGSCS